MYQDFGTGLVSSSQLLFSIDLVLPRELNLLPESGQFVLLSSQGAVGRDNEALIPF